MWIRNGQTWKKRRPWCLIYCVGHDSRIENRFSVKLLWSWFRVMGESILKFQCWIFRFCPSLCSIVHQVNACICVFFHRLVYVVLIILLFFLYSYILLWSPLPVIFILLFGCGTAIFGVYWIKACYCCYSAYGRYCCYSAYAANSVLITFCYSVNSVTMILV